MNPRIFVGVAVGVFAIVVGIVATSGSTFINDISQESTFLPSSEQTREVLPLEVELEDISILEVSDTAATIEITFKVSNPNFKSVILQMIKYTLYENNIQIIISQIGERPEGMVTGSNYYIILNENPTILRDKITLKNSGNSPEFWSALTSNSPQWKINGEAFFNLSSMTSGGEQEITFEFER